MRITIDENQQRAPGCFILCPVDENGNWDSEDDENTILIQQDTDFPSTARNFGWTGEDDNIEEAADYLDTAIGEIIDDPGYFE